MAFSYEVCDFDVLVIGGGGAGTRAAIEADIRGASCAILSKGPISHCGLTPLAYPSLQAALGHGDPRDNPELHFQDTVREGRGLGDENLMRVMADEVVQRVYDLERYGVKFKKVNGKFFQVIHPGQTYPRNVFISAGGYGMIAGLRSELLRHKRVRVLEYYMAVRLFTQGGKVVGCLALDLVEGKFVLFSAKSTILATGGYEELWELTDTAPDATGDGNTLAYKAGAEMVDMEMMLYYPTVLISPESARGVLVQYETLLEQRYLAGKILNAKGDEFLPPGPLPVRDIFIRAIFDEIIQGRGTPGGGVIIDITKSSKSKAEVDRLIKELIAVPYGNLKKLGIDLKTMPIEVAPGSHYIIGGARINERTETSIEGLYAAGEVSGNIHGANRISGNALAETQVFGARAGIFASERARAVRNFGEIDKGEVEAEMEKIARYREVKPGGLRPVKIKREIKKIMSQVVGRTRDESGLKEAISRLSRMKEELLPKIQCSNEIYCNQDWREAIEADMMMDVALIVCHGAEMRKESRGHHYRTDYPQPDDAWRKHTIIKLEGGQLTRSTAPVVVLAKR